MRKTSVKLIKLATRHTYAAFRWSLLCSHWFGSQGNMCVSRIPPCITTSNLHGSASSLFSTSNHGFIYWKLSLKCKVLANHQAIPQEIEELHYKVHFQMWQVCSRFSGAQPWEGRSCCTLSFKTSSTPWSCFGRELPHISLLAPKNPHPPLFSEI